MAIYQTDSQLTESILTLLERLRERIDKLSFSPPVAHVYNPLDYARPVLSEYVRRFAARERVVLLGMNPGPWGMAQTGVPFGEVTAVRDWMQLKGEIGRPANEHPKRPVLGWSCPRSEVSGRRLWGWAADRFGEPEAFFQRFLVLNYCPLQFLHESGRNITPDRLAPEEKKALLATCDESLTELLNLLCPTRVIGVGKFATDRARTALAGSAVTVGTILHPSPASPAANRGWAEQAEKQLREQGVL